MVSFKTKTKLLSVVCIQIVSDDYLNFLSLLEHIFPEKKKKINSIVSTSKNFINTDTPWLSFLDLFF